MTRPDWDEYFLQLAEMAATRSTCPRLQVGAVLVLDLAVIATGYNGASPKQPHCTERGCLEQLCDVHTSHCIRAWHAEHNLLRQLQWLEDEHCLTFVGQDYDRMQVYLTHEPCPRCRVALEDQGITQFHWRHPYRQHYAEGDCSLLS